ncbi:MAG: T9SS C-terminal target domain-containing protein, partial [Gammaproteobacteria bacterium]
PIDEQDNDADGYRVCDGDCDDTDPAINPGATEICNNIDDDCDGLIDEGVAYGTEVHVGNVIFTNQQAIDDFSQCYYKIQGSLTIIGTGVDSLANLSYIEYVTGNVMIQATSLDNLNGLDALDTIGGSLTIKLNNFGDSLSSLSGLQNLDTIFHNLNISFNFDLSDCCSIDDLLGNAGVGGVTTIFNNAAGCNSVNDISTTCSGTNIVVTPGNGITFGQQAEEARMSLYPNPASSTVTILLEGLGQQPGTLTISDQLGRIVMIQKLHQGQEVLDLNLSEKGMNTGVYQVTVTTETQRLVKRLMVNR